MTPSGFYCQLHSGTGRGRMANAGGELGGGRGVGHSLPERRVGRAFQASDVHRSLKVDMYEWEGEPGQENQRCDRTGLRGASRPKGQQSPLS